MSERGGSPEQPGEAAELKAKLDEMFPSNGEGKREPVRVQGKGNGGDEGAIPAEELAEQSTPIAEGKSEPTLAEAMEALDRAAAEPTPADRYAAKYGSEEGGVEPIKSSQPSPEEERAPIAKPPKPRSRPRQQPDPIKQPDIEDIVLGEPAAAPPSAEAPIPEPPLPEPVSLSDKIEQATTRIRATEGDQQKLDTVVEELVDQGVLTWAKGEKSPDGVQVEELQAATPEAKAVLDQLDQVGLEAEEPTSEPPKPPRLEDIRRYQAMDEPTASPKPPGIEDVRRDQGASEPAAASRPETPVSETPATAKTEAEAEEWRPTRVRPAIWTAADGSDSMDLDLVGEPIEYEGDFWYEAKGRPGRFPASRLEFLDEGDKPERPEPKVAPAPQAEAAPEESPEVPSEMEERVDATLQAFEEHMRTAPLEFHAVNMDEQARNRALQAAEHRLEQEVAAAHGPKALISRIWKGSLAHEYYRQRYAAEVEAEMRESNNQFVAEGKSQKAYNFANQALIERLTANLNLGTEGHSGERIEKMGTSEAEQEFQGHIRDLIGRYARDELSAEDLREERTRLFNQVRGAELLEGAHMMADNLIHVAEQAKAKVEYGAVLDDILAGIEFYADEARAGVRTEVRRTAVDKMVEKITGSRFGSLVNEATVASAVAIAYSAATIGGRHTVGNAVAVVPGIASGVFAVLRENMRFKQERAQHLRESAEGTAIDLTGRRADMEKSRYETKSATELTENLKLPEPEALASLGADTVSELLANLAEARARSQISDIRELDLISFSGVENVDYERGSLDYAIARAKTELRRWYDNANLTDQAFLGEAPNFDELLRVKTEAAAIDLAAEVKGKDRTFFRMKARAVGTAAAKGLLIGSGIGILGQEAVAMVSSDQQGELESLVGHGNGSPGEHQTLLRSLFGEHAAHGGNPGELTIQPASGSRAFFEQVDGHNTVKLPHGFVLRHHGVGEGMTLLNGSDQPVVRGLHMGQDGFTPQSQEILQQAGVTHESALVSVSEVHHVVEATSAREYFAHSQAGTAHVERTLWYDNNTSGAADQNELKLDWGNGGTGIDHNSYEFNVSHMTADGSAHGELSANAQELMREGRLHLLLSASDSTQSHPFSIAIDSHGNAHIPRESVAGRSLFSDNAGQAEFHGRYAEVAQTVGQAPQGGVEQVRILATTEGNGVNTIHHLVTRNQPELRLRTTLQVPGEHVSGGQTAVVEAAATTVPENPTDISPIVSVNTGRREMEPAGSTSTRPRTTVGPEAPTERQRVQVMGATSADRPTVVDPDAPTERLRTAVQPEENGRTEVEPASAEPAAAVDTAESTAAAAEAAATPSASRRPSSTPSKLSNAQASRYAKAIEVAQDPREITQMLNELLENGYARTEAGRSGDPKKAKIVGSSQNGQRIVDTARKRVKAIAKEMDRSTGRRRPKPTPARSAKPAAAESSPPASPSEILSHPETVHVPELPDTMVGSHTEASAARGADEPNQDQVRANTKEGIYLVADGMGGVAAGELASSIVADVVERRLSGITTLSRAEMENIAQEAQTEMQAGFTNAGFVDLDGTTLAGGTTLTAMKLLGPDKAMIFNAGDSVLMRIRDNQLTRVTPEQFNSAQPSQVLNAIYTQAPRPGITALDSDSPRDLSRRDIIDVIDLKPGDRYILCSDGVTGDREQQRLSDEQIMAAVAGRPASEAAEALAAASLKTDDTTALVVDIPAT